MAKITIHNMHNHTAEEVFRACLEPVLKRGTQASIDGGLCSYEKGCAAGQLLSAVEARAFDELDEFDEFDEVDDKSWYYLVNSGLVPDHHCEVIAKAQFIHDQPYLVPPVRQARNYCKSQGWSSKWLEQFDENMSLL